MPTIPQRTDTRQLKDVDLGREAPVLPGIGEQTQLQQITDIVQKSSKVAALLFDRQDKKKKESDDLAANEAYLGYVAASRQKEIEFDKTLPTQSDGMFLRWKKEQDNIYNNSVAGLTEEQLVRFNAKVNPYGLETNTRIARRQQALHQQRIKDNYEGSALASETNAYDNLANQKLFYQHINESRTYNKELWKLDGVDEKKIDVQDKRFFSKSVKEAITLTAAMSYSRAEDWYSKALKDGELTTQDALILRNDLDKYKRVNEDNDLQKKTQEILDDIFANEGIELQTAIDYIRKNYSGKSEEMLIKGAKIRDNERLEQDAANQRQFLRSGKSIIDQSPNAHEARQNVRFIMASPKSTIKTAKTLDDYIQDVFVKPPRKESDPFKLQQAYTIINQNVQGKAKPEDIIENVDDLIMRFRPYLSNPDMKGVADFYRNGGFLGRNTYADIQRSYSELTDKTLKEIREDKATQADFNAYIRELTPLLPPDRTINPYDLRTLGAGVLAAKKGETPTTEIFWQVGYGVDETLEEAREAGRERDWLPVLDDNTRAIAKQLLATENEIMKSLGRAAIPETELALREMFKEQIMRIKHRKKK